MLVRVLQNFGLEVEQAASGEEALATLAGAIERGRPFTMIFTDWVMPGLGGRALIQAIRSRFAANLPRVIVVSGYDTEKVRQSVESLGVDHFLAKPVLPSSLGPIFASLQDVQAATDVAMSAKQALSLKGMRVLLAEDHPINQQLAMELLQDVGVSPDLAQHGEDVIRLLAAHHPDYFSLVLMDLQMPVLDGYETTKRLRADARYARLPIVAMTAHVTPEEQERCLALGMVGHIGKPIDPEELYRVLASFSRSEARKKLASEGYAGAAQPATSYSKESAQANAATTLPGIAGLDTQLGLNCTGGKQTFYLSLLSQFLSEFRSFPEQVAELLRAGKLTDAERLAHSLKGVAANIGARRVAEAAGELERALHRGEPLEPAVEGMKTELSSVIGGLTAYFAADKTVAGPSPLVGAGVQSTRPSPLPEWVDELRRLLSDGDVAAQQLWERRGEELKDRLPMQRYGQIRRAMENFDFDSALDALSTEKTRI
jgi:two-component system sensor histidine kinase/response regulator